MCMASVCVDVSRREAMLMLLTTKIIHLCTGPVITVSYTAHIMYWSDL